MASPKTTATPKGMVDRSSWRRTQVHTHSSYACGFCGLRFESPSAFYGHAERGHGKVSERRGRPAISSPEVRAA
jgi:hypothetical protein